MWARVAQHADGTAAGVVPAIQPTALGDVSLNAATTSPDTLAREHTQLVCGMNLAMLAAVTDRVSNTELVARLEPAPDRCCVVLEAC